MAKGLEYSKCSVISDSRKKNQLACHHKALVPSRLGRGFLSGSSEVFLFWPPLRFAERKHGGYGQEYPADAGGAIGLSFRAFSEFS